MFKIAVVTTTRAEFGLLYPFLKRVLKDDELELELLVSGTHLSHQHGFTINEKDSEMEIASGDSGWVEFKYNNITYRTLVKNYADYATIAQNCFVTTIKTSEFDPKFDLIIPGNIKRGDSEADLLAVIEKFNYEKDESGDFIYYTVYDPDKSKLDAYDITVHEGKVHSIEVQNAPKKSQMTQ